MSMHDIHAEVPTGTVQGTCDPRFSSVADRFVANFHEHGEIGASLCLMLDGETVLDLWGGSANPRDNLVWERETVSVVHSCTKGALALMAHMLAERGKLDLDAPVTELWPEYGQNGKEKTTTAMMLDHTAGVPAFREEVKPEGFLDWDYMTARIAAEEAFFEPGTRSSYHGLTFAWTVGEMIRRAAGKTAGQFFAEEITGPLGLDFWIGLPEEIEPRVARLFAPVNDPSQPRSSIAQAISADRQSIPALFYLNTGGFNPNKRPYRAAEIGSGAGVTNGRGLAGLYAPLAQGGGRLVNEDTLARMGRTSNASRYDATLCVPLRFSEGFMKSNDNRWVSDPPAPSAILGEAAFGHGGNGGSYGFADPELRLSFGYTMNQLGLGQLLNARGQGLIDAAYGALGYRTDVSGAWRK